MSNKCWALSVCDLLSVSVVSSSCYSMNCSPPGSSVLEASPGKNTGVSCHSLLKGSSQPRDQTEVSCTAGGLFTDWATRKAHYLYSISLFLKTNLEVGKSLSPLRLLATPWTAAHQASLSFTISQSLLKLMSIESVMPSNHIILYCPLLLLPSIFPSIRVFSNESALCIRWPKYWSFSFSISPSSEYSGLISLRIDWFDLLAVQGSLKSLLQHHNLKASILQFSVFFKVQLSHPHVTIGKKKP